jgi:6-phosphogluconate dehydrogenase
VNVEKAANEFGVVGLGRMGGGLAMQALEKKMTVAGFELRGASAELRQDGLKEVSSLAGFRTALKPSRAVFVYVPAGPVVDKVIDDLAKELEPGDIIVDGGNSYWG